MSFDVLVVDERGYPLHGMEVHASQYEQRFHKSATADAAGRH